MDNGEGERIRIERVDNLKFYFDTLAHVMKTTLDFMGDADVELLEGKMKKAVRDHLAILSPLIFQRVVYDAHNPFSRRVADFWEANQDEQGQ